MQDRGVAHRTWLQDRWGFKCSNESAVLADSKSENSMVLPFETSRVGIWAKALFALGDGDIKGVQCDCHHAVKTDEINHLVHATLAESGNA